MDITRSIKTRGGVEFKKNLLPGPEWPRFYGIVKSQIIVGVDPGSRVAGFGVLKIEGDRFTHLEHGVIRLSEKAPHATRLLELGERLRQIFECHSPFVVVVEKVFLAHNADSAFKLGQARGVCLYEAARSDAVIAEYAAREIKKGVTGSGAATKEQVRLLILGLLGIQSQQPEDATDALAMAWHHANCLSVQKRLSIGLNNGTGEISR